MTALRRLVLSGVVGGVLAAAAVPALAQGGQKVGMLEIKGSPLTRPGELSWLMGSGEPTLRELVEAIRAAGEDEALSPIVIRLKDAELSRTQVEELGAAIKDVRASGKQVHVFS